MIQNKSLIFSLLMMAAVGCKDKVEETPPVETVVTEEQKIEAALNEVLTRLSYRDKTGLYDMEFEYIQKHYTFDDYVDFPQIKTVVADTSERFEVISIQRWENDSALVVTKYIHGEEHAGHTHGDMEIDHKMYFHHGRWIKPTVGTIDGQLKFEQLRHAADSAAAAEEAEDGA